MLDFIKSLFVVIALRIIILTNIHFSRILQKRWKNIRDNFYKQKKHVTKTTGSAGSGKRKRNPILDQLGFLETVEHERQ